ncbi:MAG: DUF465 domain-containing protein [Hyphomicrobiales bacterium]
MALEAHLNELKLKHQQMEAEITNEAKFASTDQSKINGLKRQKLKIKEEITDIKSQLAS